MKQGFSNYEKPPNLRQHARFCTRRDASQGVARYTPGTVTFSFTPFGNNDFLADRLLSSSSPELLPVVAAVQFASFKQLWSMPLPCSVSDSTPCEFVVVTYFYTCRTSIFFSPFYFLVIQSAMMGRCLASPWESPRGDASLRPFTTTGTGQAVY